jgi:sugar lactone lactonase YvrE
VTTSRFPAVALALALWLLPDPARPAGFVNQLGITLDDKEGPLRAPEGVACGDKGVLVVADTGNARLLTYTWRDGRLAGGAPIRLAQVTVPVRLQIDGHGDVLVLDRRTRRIVRVDAAGKYAGTVELRGASGPGAVVVTAFKLDAADNLYALDVAGRRVLVARPDGRVTRELALPRGGEEFTDLAVDQGGRVLAVDAVGSRLWAADKGTSAFKALGEGLKDRVAFPIYLFEDRGRLWLVDQHGHGLVQLSADGAFQARELEMGWMAGKVYYPAQACTTGDGLIFVADRSNNRIQAFSDGR